MCSPFGPFGGGGGGPFDGMPFDVFFDGEEDESDYDEYEY